MNTDGKLCGMLVGGQFYTLPGDQARRCFSGRILSFDLQTILSMLCVLRRAGRGPRKGQNC